MRDLNKTRIVASVLFLLIGAVSVSAINNLLHPDDVPNVLGESVSLTNIPKEVLGEKDENPIFFTVNVPARFKKNLTAPNIVYSVTGGEGVEVSEGQYPEISNSGVLSLQGLTGELLLTNGDGISINGLEVSNTLSFIGSGGTTVSRVGDAITVTSSTPDYTLSGWAKVGTSVGLTTATDSVTVDTIIFGNATITNGKSIKPDTDLGSDLGSSAFRFNNLYVGNINSNSSTSTAGQATFTYESLSTALTEASVLINPTAPIANGQLLGLSVAGYQRALIDEDGDLTLGYNDAISAPASDYPLSVYGHNGTEVAYIDTLGYLGTGGSIIMNGVSGSRIRSDSTGLVSILNGAGSAYGRLKFGDGSASLPALQFGLDTNTGIYRPGTDSLSITTGGVSRLVVDASGKVGIGDTTPNYTLDVVGSVNSTIGYYLSNGLAINKSGTRLEINDNGNFAETVFSYGNVGIGVTVPATALDVLGDATVASSDNQGRLYFGRNNYGLGGAFPQSIRNSSGIWYFTGLAGEELVMNLNAGGASVLDFIQGDLELNANAALKSLKLQTQGVDRVIVDSDGQVGIGVADPLFGIDLGTSQIPTSSIRGYAFRLGEVGSDTHVGQLNYLYGNSGVGRINFYKDQAALTLGVHDAANARNIIQITNQQASSIAYNHSIQANPSLFIHSQTSGLTAQDQWISFTHDQTNGVITTGSGDLILSPAENVGIGTTDPREKLEVNGNIRLPANASIYGEANGAGLSISNAAVLTIRRETSAYYASNSAFIGFQFRGATNQSKSILDILKPAGLTGNYFSISDVTEGDILTVDSSGQVGIGTDTPLGNLTVKSSAIGATPLRIENSNGALIFSVYNGTGAGAGGAMIQLRNASSIETVRITSDGGHSWFSSGSVGIGIDTPAKLLDVAGDVRIGPDDGATVGTLQIKSNIASTYAQLYANGSGSNTTLITSTKFRATESQAGIFSTVGTNQDLNITPNGTGDVLLNGSGLVGINDATPLYSLDVTGMMRATEGVITYTKAGTISDVDFTETPIDGLMGVDSTNGRLYFRHGGAWHYVAQTAGFQIPEYETYVYDFGSSSFDTSSPLADGDFLIPFVEGRMSDGAIHGLYTSFSDVKDQLFADELSRILSLEQRVTALEAGGGLSTNPLLSSTGSIGTVAGWTDTLWTFLGDVRFNGDISVSPDTAGTVTVPTGSTTISHSFSSAFTKAPVIYLTPVDAIEGNYHLQQVSPTTFIVELSQPQIGNVSFNWLAIVKN